MIYKLLYIILLIFFANVLSSFSQQPPNACEFFNKTGKVRIIADFYLNDSTIYYESGFQGVDYVDKTDFSAKLAAGGTYNYTIYAGVGFAYSPYYYFIFIDFDGDGNFTTPGDTVAFTNTLVIQFINGNFKIPITAKYGTYRMRVTNGPAQTEGVVKGCGDGGEFSQAVDFTIHIVKQISVDSLLKESGVRDSVFCAGSNIEINFSAYLDLNGDNFFTAQLSDANGNFSNPFNLGSLPGNKKGKYKINGLLPKVPESKNYKIRIISSNPQYISDTITNITINPLPVPIIEGKTSVCQFQTETYRCKSNPDITISWEAIGGIILSPDDLDTVLVGWNETGTKKLILTMINNKTGCIDKSIADIEVNPTPLVNINGEIAVCLSEIYIYSAEDDSIPSTYQWIVSSTGTVIGASNQKDVTVRWQSLGTGFVKLIKKYASGCTDSSSININVSDIKPIPIIEGKIQVCLDNSLEHSVKEKNAGSLYKWKAVGGRIIGSDTEDKVLSVWERVGTDTLILIEKNNLGCSDSALLIINVNPKPNPRIIGETSVCQNVLMQYQTKNEPGSKYLWTVLGGNIIGRNDLSDVNVKWDNTQQGEIKVYVVNEFLCTDSSELKVTINEFIPPAVEGDKIACIDENSVFFSLNSNPNYNYKWKIIPENGGTIIGADNLSRVEIAWNSTGKQNLILEQSNIINGCKDSAIFEVFVSEIIIEPLKVKIACPGDIIEINFRLNPQPDSVGKINFKMINTDGFPIYEASVDYSPSNPTRLLLPDDMQSGTYILYLNCKQYNDTLTIGLPPPRIIGSKDVCHDYTAEYTTDTKPDFRYFWQVIGGTIIGRDDAPNVRILWGESGIGAIRLFVIDRTGCSGNKIELVNIYYSNPRIEGDSLICWGQMSKKYFINAPGAIKKWVVSGGDISGSDTSETVLVNWKLTGKGKVTLYLFVPTGSCRDTVSLPVEIDDRPLPPIKITGTSAVCENTIHNYSISAAEGFKIKWIVFGGIIEGSDSSANITVRWGLKTEARVIAELILSSGCRSADTLPINIASSITKIFGNTYVCRNETTKYYTSHNNNLQNEWSVSGGNILGPNDKDTIIVSWVPTILNRLVTLKQTTLPENCEGTVIKPVYINYPALDLYLPEIITNPATHKDKIDSIILSSTKSQCIGDLETAPDSGIFYISFAKSLFLPASDGNIFYKDYNNKRQIEFKVRMKDIESGKPVYIIKGNILLGDTVFSALTLDSLVWAKSGIIQTFKSGYIRLVNIPDIDGIRLIKHKDLTTFIYPNPSDGNLTLVAFATREFNARISIFDNLGNEIFKQEHNLNSGSNSFSFEKRIFPTSGIYYLQINSGTFIISDYLNITK